MATSTDKLKVELEDYASKSSLDDDLRMRIKALCETDINHSKQYIFFLKEILQAVPFENDYLLKMMVSLYLSLDHKHPAKKCLSSFFQNLQLAEKAKVHQFLCQLMSDSFVDVFLEITVPLAPVRQAVDNVTALMDNFPLGEDCISCISSSVVVFLSKAQLYFFQQFRMPDQSAMMMNSTMHSCHVTMQALNRLFQRHAPQQEKILSLQSSAFRQLISADLQILLHEPMMADCRCCCAINLVLLLSLSVPDLLIEVTCALFTCGETNIELPPWLQGIDLLQINMAKLSAMAALCTLWGLISMLPLEIMVLEVDSQDKTPLFAVILKKLLELDERCVSMSTQAQAVKTITLWTTRMYFYLQTGQIKEREKFKMRGSGSVTRRLLNFVWTHWQDQLEIVRLNSRITFENCIKIHMLASTYDNPSGDPFLLSMLKQILDVSWCNPSKFGVLGSLVQCMGSAPVLQAHANFPLTLLQQIQDQGVACQVSDLYERMMKADKVTRCQQEGETNTKDWLEEWISPVIFGLCGSNKKLKQHIIEYLLPRILKCDKSVLEFLLSELAVSGKQYGKHSGGPLGALIICMRRARAGGLLAWPQSSLDSVSAFGDRVCDALGSQDEQVRLDALALLCENKKTTELISQLEFDHVQYFISHNLNNQSPAFRQAVLSSLRKLFTRIIESYGALLRKKPDTVQRKPWKDATESYNSFLAWLEEYVFEQLYPGAAFARRMMSLSILSLLLQEIQTLDSYQPLKRVTLHHLHSLLECLTDTYEENKHEAFKLLLASTRKCGHLLTEKHCKELYSCAMHLATSTRPQDSSTAAYLFRFLLQQSCISSVIKGHKLELQNPACINKLLQEYSCPGKRDPDPSYHDTCSSGGLTEEAPHVSFNTQNPFLSDCTTQYGRKHSAPLSSSEAPECTLPENHLQAQELVLDTVSGVWLTVSNTEIPTVLQQLQVLLSLLVDQVVIAGHSLVVAAASRPMHPTLHSIRCILSTLDLGSVDERCRALWSEFIGCLLQTCFQVAEVVSPVVQNSSPEGNVPQEAILGPGLNFDVKIIAEAEDVQQTVSLMPEYLVVCSWRSIKEVSLLLGQLCLSLPVTQPGVNQGLLSLQQVEDIGVYFKKQLMESLHRGAFELAYAGFVMMCQMLWRSSWSQLQQLPKQWLRDVLAVVVAEDRSTALCATRRSAGIPFFLQAILATESTAMGRLSFHQVMRQLLDVAFSSFTLHPSRTDTCVHALNILRALFRDTRLREDVASYISEGLMAAVMGFKSQYWEIRNSATLLLSALITRMFGVKRNKDDSVLSKRNSQTGRAFFYKYPALFQFLLTELETATQSAANTGQLHLCPSLYPVLMVLGHLFPSTMEEDSTHLNLAAFVPHIIKCASSPVYKTRIMAARALQPLVNKEQICRVLTTLLSYLPKCPEEKLRISHSHLHGVLLQVYHLLLLLPDLCGGLLHEACDVCIAGLGACTWLVTRENKCLLTRKVAMEVIDLVVSHAEVIQMTFSAPDLDLFKTIKCLFLTTLRSEVKKKASEYSPYTPSLPDFLSCMGLLAMKWLVLEVSSGTDEDSSESVISGLLNFDAYEVHISVLDSLLASSGKAKMLKTNQAQTPDRKGEDIDSLTADYFADNVKTTYVCQENKNHKTTGSILTEAVVHQLLHMGLQAEGHPATLIKVFHVLLSVPDISQYASDENLIDVFDSLLLKIDLQKRSDVKASAMEFCGSLLPYLLNKLQKGSTERVRSLLCKLKDILMTWCQAEQPEELQLACAHILCSHASSLLLDKDRCLGTIVLDFWTMVVYLLQADDLEVKEVMASVTADSSLSQREGGSHPEQALLEMVNTMFVLHGHVYELQCVSIVLSWLQNLFACVRLCNYEDSTQRLFDKGELNSFQDEVSFAKIISRTVETWSVHAHKEGLPENLHAKNETCQLQSKNLVVDPEAIKAALTALTNAISEITSNISRTKATSTKTLYLETSLYNEQVQSLIHAAVVAHIIKSVFIIGRLRGCHPEVELAYELLLQRIKMCSDTMEMSNCLLKKICEEI